MYQTYTTSTGAVLTYRRLPIDTADMIRSAVMIELSPDRPTPPEQVVETASGPQTVVNETHPDHIEAVVAWDARVARETGLRLARLATDYGLEPTPIDHDAVDAYRAAMAAVGVTINERDSEIFFWRLVCPDSGEIQVLMRKIMGLEALEEAIRVRRQAFRGPVPGAIDMGSTTPEE